MTRWAYLASATLVFIGAGAMAPVTQTAQRGPSIGYVNTDQILRQTPGFGAVDTTLQQEGRAYEQEIERMQGSLDSAVADFQRQSTVLSAAARQDKTAQLRQMQTQLQQRYAELQQRAQERRDELLSPLEERIQTVIDGVRAERNLAIVFDIASPGGNIVSADAALNLSALVISRLRGGGDR